MEEPTQWLDEDGYPTEEALARIKLWPAAQAPGLFAFIGQLWRYPDWWRIGPAQEVLTPAELEVAQVEPQQIVARFATGGWSGNEALIDALKRNRIIAVLTWVLSAKGGLYVFRVPEGELSDPLPSWQASRMQVHYE